MPLGSARQGKVAGFFVRGAFLVFRRRRGCGARRSGGGGAREGRSWGEADGEGARDSGGFIAGDGVGSGQGAGRLLGGEVDRGVRGWGEGVVEEF